VFDAEDTLAGSLAVVRAVVAADAEPREMETAASGLLLATMSLIILVGRACRSGRAHEIVERSSQAAREDASSSRCRWPNGAPSASCSRRICQSSDAACF